ncbi:MAG: hypothetical protein JSV74_01415 [Dehalococcoidia bacterium]|nr:MAG: hypothetical protein JSV74_01415 [Dehalococcoidia bacterium]
MSMSQKFAWIQLLIFTAVIIGWSVIFISNGTIFYWQNDSMMITFYIISAIGFGLLVLMNLVASIRGSRGAMRSDERDKSIWRRASLWATGVSYTIVGTLLLVVAIIYMNQGSDVIPVYFPLFIVLIGGVALLLTQAITALILYGRKVNYGEN